MTLFSSLRLDTRPPAVFTKYAQSYGQCATMSQTMMHGPSPSSRGELDLTQAYAAAVTGFMFIHAFTLISRKTAAKRTRQRSKCRYVNLYSAFRKTKMGAQ